MKNENKLIKSSDLWVSGVCGGIADYMGIDAVIVRLIFAIGAAYYGVFVAVYVILMFLMPEE